MKGFVPLRALLMKKKRKRGNQAHQNGDDRRVWPLQKKLGTISLTKILITKRIARFGGNSRAEPARKKTSKEGRKKKSQDPYIRKMPPFGTLGEFTPIPYLRKPPEPTGIRPWTPAQNRPTAPPPRRGKQRSKLSRGSAAVS